MPLAIVIAAVVVYGTSLSYPFVFDDQATIVENTSIRTLASLRVFSPDREVPSAGRPLVNLSHAMNYAAGGLDPFGYRIVNLLLHASCGLVLFAVIRRTLAGLDRPEGVRRDADAIAFASALLWTVHPLNTEVVEYVTQRSESMMALCYLLTIYCAVRSHASSRTGSWPALSVAACAAGMLCKESMATAPLALWLYDRTFVFGSWVGALRARWRLYLALAGTWLILAAAIWSGPRAYSAGFSTTVSPWMYLLNQPIAIARYLALAVWPHGLVVAYGPPEPIAVGTALPYVLLVATLGALTLTALVRWPRVGFVGAWLFLTLAPTSSIVPIATEVAAERRMYLALGPLIALVVVAGTAAVHRAMPRRARLALTSIAVALALLFGAVSLARLHEYKSPLGLAQTVLDRHPSSFAHAIVGTQLAVAGRHDAAIAELRLAVPGYPRAYYHLGGELFNTGQVDAAVPPLQAFVDRLPWLEEAVPARLMIGRALMLQRDWTAAEAQLRMVLQMAPAGSDRYVTALGYLADSAFSQQRFDEALTLYPQFIAARPRDVGAAINLGVALAQLGRTPEAIAEFRRAVQIDPRNDVARRNLALAEEDLRARR